VASNRLILESNSQFSIPVGMIYQYVDW